MVEHVRPRLDIASPWVLGLYALATATFIVGARIAGWYGGSQSSLYLFPFAAIFGGIAQFLAAMWAFRTRDTLATAMLGTWSSFWMAYGVLNLLYVTGKLAAPTGAFPELGFWFIALAAITWVGTANAYQDRTALGVTLGLLAAASTLAAIADLGGLTSIARIGGWLFLIAGIAAWYTASELLFEMTRSESATTPVVTTPDTAADQAPGATATGTHGRHWPPVSWRRAG